MNTISWAALIPLFVASSTAAQSEPRPSPLIGDVYQITKVRDSSTSSSDGSSANSHDQDAIVERIEALRPDGRELLFDLPPSTTAEERRQTWQFPARVFEADSGARQLLNTPELEQRVDAWLKAGKMTREACGRWIFTWNAFRIECDPQSVLASIEAFEPKLPELREGALYRDAYGLSPVPLIKRSSSPTGSTYTATLLIDPKLVQRDRAEADVVVGEITRKPVTLEAALAQRAKETVLGTMKVVIETDSARNLRRLIKTIRQQTVKPSGQVDKETVTETLERRRISSGKS